MSEWIYVRVYKCKQCGGAAVWETRSPQGELDARFFSEEAGRVTLWCENKQCGFHGPEAEFEFVRMTRRG
ncbi:MAG: hypothetical protein HY656_02200 [Acidobacteria bacterium]|nr:hypothetical protein [Acidobacteriota bacterium]